MRDLKQERMNIEKQLREMSRQVDQMDAKIRAYLADRQSNPHPRHEDFITRIQSFHIQSGLSTKQLDTLLDSLQWKVYYAARAWRQLWENSENLRRMERQQGRPEPQMGNTIESKKSKSSIYSVDKLWKVQQERLKEMGNDPVVESKGEFVKRIKKEYGQLASSKTRGEEITMTFDEQAGRCTLEKKKKTGVKA